MEEKKKHCVVRECFVIWSVFLLQEKQLSCVANQNGSQADCELGNPFKRNSSVGDAFTYYTLIFKIPLQCQYVQPMLTAISVS